MPTHKDTLTEQYDQTLHYTRDKRLPAGHPKPQPTACWPAENIALYERYRAWLLTGGTSELASQIIYLPVAGHVLGLSLKPHPELDLEEDFQRTLEYVIAKQSSPDWIKASRNGLNKFRRFLRLERGLGEEQHVTPFDSARVTAGLPACSCMNWIAINASCNAIGGMPAWNKTFAASGQAISGCGVTLWKNIRCWNSKT